jgi:uncharacterized protein
MIRVVPDTNIYISAFLFGGKPALLLDHIEGGLLTLFYSRPIQDEVEEVLAEKFGWPSEMIELACAPFWSIGQCVKPKRAIHACSDADDDRILECAVEAQAEFIVTGDKHLLQMVRFEGISILEPDEFLKAAKL